MPNTLRCLLVVGVALLAATGCSGLRDALEPQPPKVSVAGLRVTALSFNHADLALDLRLQNPNAVAVDLDGFDYRLAVDGRSVVQGEQRRRLELAARDTTPLEVPLRLNFGDVAAVIGSLAGRDRIEYAIDVGLDVDVPVLGPRRVTASAADSLPIPQRPELELRSLRVTRLGITGATVEARLGVSNPNVFALTLDRLDWGLALEGTELLSAGTTAPLRIGPDGSGELTFRIELDHADVAGSLYELLDPSGPVNYRLRAMLAATAADGRLGTFEVPLGSSGQWRIR